jgi:hypothetical protein
MWHGAGRSIETREMGSMLNLKEREMTEIRNSRWSCKVRKYKWSGSGRSNPAGYL